MSIILLSKKEVRHIANKLPDKWAEQPFFIDLDTMALGRFLCVDDQNARGPEYTNVYFAPLGGWKYFNKIGMIRNVLKEAIPKDILISPANGEAGVYERGYFVLLTGEDGNLRMKQKLDAIAQDKLQAMTKTLERLKIENYAKEREAKLAKQGIKQELIESGERSKVFASPPLKTKRERGFGGDMRSGE